MRWARRAAIAAVVAFDGLRPPAGLGSRCGCSRGSGRGLDDIAFRLEHNRWERHLATLVVLQHLK